MKNDAQITVKITTSTEEYFLEINGTSVPCSREVYLAYKRPGRKEAMREYRGQRPFINGRRCLEDCRTCINFAGGKCELAKELSLDKEYADTSFEPKHSANTEDEAELRILIANMFHELKNEDERCREILGLMIQELSQREIAKELNIATSTVTHYIKKIRKKLDKFR
ncbi:LuxR C-terminal-related transcriptional regulator [Butyrivibrio sp. MB2005]|uniref:LuxR C-terminal-related transcriptional regulator n=1 Tax=Butyrivibrio sp. MB2005 TaxID=1280678 RepID=UPI0004282DF4|nr:LuxR C-terminal-related transcriptional regulator [Butyrivibrio sp. MB2005]